MYCKRCGKENSDEARFCSYCGAPLSTLENTQETNLYETYEEPQKSHKWLLTVLVVLIVIIVLVIGGAFVYDRFLRPSIDLNDYVVFEVTGSSPNAEAKASIDWTKMNEEHGDEIRYTLMSHFTDKDIVSDNDPIDYLNEKISVEANRTTGLSDGDKITYAFNVDEEVNDVIHVSFGVQRGTYTVKGLTHYLSSRDEMDDTTLASARSIAESVFTDYCSTWAESTSLEKFTYVGNSLNVSNDGHSELDLVYAADVKNTAEDDTYSFAETDRFFWVAVFKDLEVGTDGAIAIDLTDCSYVSENEYTVTCDELNRTWSFYGYESLNKYKSKYLNDPVNCTYDTDVSDADLPALAESESKSKDSDENKVIGTVTVKVSNLNIRESASSSSQSLGHAEEGETYDVYEKKSEDGYTWYRIGAGKWVADNGEWLTYKES